MKNILLICTLSLFLVVSNGCKKPPLPIPVEENDSGSGSGSGSGGNEVLPSEYVGKWDYDEIEFKNGVLQFQGNDVGTFVGEGTNIKGSLEISENPNVWTSSVEFTASLDATFFGQTQAQEAPVDEVVTSGTWEESGTEITMTTDAGDDVMILSSTSSKIVFTDNFTEEISVGQGFAVDANSDVEFTLTK